MLKTLSIKNFRCFKEFNIDSLNKINLITGKNNTGKTALLEAFFLLLGAKAADIPTRLNSFRGASTTLDADKLWGWLFYHCNTNEKIELDCITSKKDQHTVKISLDPSSFVSFEAENERLTATGIANKDLNITYTSPKNKTSAAQARINKNGIQLIPPVSAELAFPFSIYLPSNTLQVISPQKNVEIYNKLENMGEEKEFIQALRIIEPKLIQLKTDYTVGTAPYLLADLGFRPLIPVAYMGDGINRLMAVLLSIASVQPGGCLLLDEMEIGFHYSMMPQVWQAISTLALARDVQIIATTHSLEFVRAATQINQDDVFRLYRLERNDDQINVVTYTEEALETSIEFGFEVR